MVHYKNNRWHLCTEKVRYIQHGQEVEQYVGSEGHDWWIDFEERWEHTEIIEFIPVEPTQEQMDRYGEILELGLPDGFGGLLSDYVEKGEFPEGHNHPLAILQLKKENERQGVELSEREIDEIMLGIQLSDLEIQLLEIQIKEGA